MSTSNHKPSLSLLQAIFTESRDSIVIADATVKDSPVLFVNPAFLALTGYSEVDVLGKNCRFLQAEDTDQSELEVFRNALRDQQPCLVVLHNKRKDGSLFWNELSLSPIHDDAGELHYFLSIQRDVTSIVEAEKAQQETLRQLREMAIKDPLTQLYNRRYFFDQFSNLWGMATREKRGMCVMLMDLDEFKTLNDCYGHQAGDEALVKVSASLEQHFRRGSDILARYGGEEFIAVTMNMTQFEAEALAQELCEGIEALALPNEKATDNKILTISIGICYYSGLEPVAQEEIIRHADEMLYLSKDSGRNCWKLSQL